MKKETKKGEECPKYQYHVLTWGGFYNEEHKSVHGLEEGDFVFDTKEERDSFVASRKALSAKLGAWSLCVFLTEGFHCDVRTVLHRVSEYKGERRYSSYDIGINYPLHVAAYHMANKWFPGHNDYPFGEDDENDSLYGGPDFRVLDEWITGATCNDSNNGGRSAGDSDMEILYT